MYLRALFSGGKSKIIIEVYTVERRELLPAVSPTADETMSAVEQLKLRSSMLRQPRTFQWEIYHLSWVSIEKYFIVIKSIFPNVQIFTFSNCSISMFKKTIQTLESQWETVA